MSLQRSDFRFAHRLRVRWVEVDMQKIVFNAHYLMYFDNAMGDYWRALALPYVASMQLLGGDTFVKKATLEYHASARYDDMLEVCLKCARIGTSSLVFQGAIFCGDTLLVTGELIYVFADPLTQTAKPVPPELRSIFDAYEVGRSVVDLELGQWDTVEPKVSTLRREVFVAEQGIAADLVWDDSDARALHAVVCNGLGEPVASGRLVQHGPGVGRIGRMAVVKVLRGTRLGRDVLHALLKASEARGDHTVMLHAQLSAEDFYTRAGFTVSGEPFQEAGIAHIAMTRRGRTD
jgi:YbgC/YbaW family acyl-CoA thioester hydrolase